MPTTTTTSNKLDEYKIEKKLIQEEACMNNKKRFLLLSFIKSNFFSRFLDTFKFKQ